MNITKKEINECKMSTDEIICLSSEDEASDQDKVICSINDSSNKKNGITNECRTKKRQLSSPVVGPKGKRVNLNSSVKTNIEDIESDEAIEVIGIIAKKVQTPESSLVTDSNGKDSKAIASTVHESGKNTPLLVIKEKHPVHSTCGRQDVFSMFISQCLQRNKSADMYKIVDKLKRKYEQLNPHYVQSQEFEDLLNEKRDCLMSENGTLYKHISVIYSEMKKWKNNKIYVSSSKKNSQNVTSDEDEKNGDPETTRKLNNKIKSIEKAMQIVERRIKKYEEADVDLDDFNSSNFLISERYKKRMVELYAKWCELTGSHKDAGRTYLRPVHLKLTGITNVDQAINSFINSKFNEKKNPKNKLTSSNTLVFPDFIDILNLIHAHNVTQKLGMDTRAERSTAKAAFLKLGEYLKCERQKDFYDTFSSIYAQNDDPATKDVELMAKLRENRDLGEKNLNAIFDEYCKKQDITRSMDVNKKNHVSGTENEHEQCESETSDEGDDESDVNSSDSDICYDSDASIRNLDDSNDDKAIINHINDKRNTPELDDRVMKMEITPELTASETKSTDEISILSVDNNLMVDNKNNMDKVATSNSEVKVKKDMKMPTSEITTGTNESITSNTQAIINEVGIKRNGLDDKSTELSEKTVEEEKPLLKLRSFAKSPVFWKNSRESKDEITAEWNNTVTNQKLTDEVIEIETMDREIPRNETDMCYVDKNIIDKQFNSSSCQLTSIPLISTSKDVKIFRRCITIPALKLTQISKSSARQTRCTSINKNVSIQSNAETVKSPGLIPLSAIEIRNEKTTPRITHIVGQRKENMVSILKNNTHISSSASNSHGSPPSLIHPVTKGATILPKTVSKSLSVNKDTPVDVRNNSSIDLVMKSTSQKVINPVVKYKLHQQEDTKKIVNKVSGCNDDIATTGSPFISI